VIGIKSDTSRRPPFAMPTVWPTTTPTACPTRGSSTRTIRRPVPTAARASCGSRAGKGALSSISASARGASPPDEGILTRPGHRRRVTGLRRYLSRRGIDTWVKADPSALGTSVPKTARDRFPGFEHVFKRYGAELYACAHVPRDLDRARVIVQAFLDILAYERGWQVMKACEAEYDAFHNALRDDLFASPTTEEVNGLLRSRRFVILQGPPGTGKTRMADEVRRQFFHGRGMTVQFHPAVTYEDFVVGLSPNHFSALPTLE